TLRQGTGIFYCPPAVRASALSRSSECAAGVSEVAAVAGCRPSRTSEKTTASAQITTDTRKAWTIPLVKSAEMLAGRWPTVLRKTAFMTAGGIEAAATASARAKLKTMPTLRIVLSVAEATPRRLRGAAPIVVLVLGDQKRPLPTPMIISASASTG